MTITKIKLIGLLILFPTIAWSQLDSSVYFKSKIDSLNVFGNAIIESVSDEDKQQANTHFKRIMEELLANDSSFYAHFGKVEKLSVLQAHRLKIYNWALPHTNGTYTYFAYTQFKTDEGKIILKELIDKSDELEKLETKTFTPNFWFGALYYEIIHDKKLGEKYYTVLGWDGNNLLTNKKVIDVIEIDDKGNIKLGAPIFKMERRTQRRVIFEYAKMASMSLKYHPKQKQIVFDFLVPSSSRVKGIYEYYGPALDTFDALTLDKTKWTYQKDVEVTLEKTGKEKNWNDPNK
jgi:hypothetical protein